MSKEITKPERVMYYEGSKMRFLEYVDQLESYVEKLEAKQLILSGVSVPKGTLCEHDYQADITCGVDITACSKCGDVI